MQVLVGSQLVGRDGKDVEVFREVTAFLSATLPLPIIVDVTTKSVEANQIHTAASFEIELSAPLVTDVVE